MSESIVQKKLGKLIQQELGTILGRNEILSQGRILTISVVRITRDLGLAKIYVSVLPDNALNEVVDALNKKVWDIRYQLAGRIRNKIRKIPELHFYADDSFQEAERINKLLDSLQSNEINTEDKEE